MSDDKTPLPGFGRGGRGAALLAALQNQPRRPGQTSQPPPATEAPEEPKPLGRGAFLQSLLQGRGRAIPPTVSAQPTPVASHPDPPRPLGRGRGLILSSILSESVKSPPSVTPTPLSPRAASPASSIADSSTSYSAPVAELEELDIGTYRGESGQRLPLEVNYVYIQASQGKGIYEYHVSFRPQVDSKNMKFKLMNDQKVRDVIGMVKTFDGAKLYLPLKLESSPVNINVHMPTDQSVVTVSIKLIKQSKAADCIHLYNLLFRKVMRILKMTQVII